MWKGLTFASGIVDTVLTTGAAAAGSTYMAGLPVTTAGKLQIETSAPGATATIYAGVARKPSGVVYVTTTGGTRVVAGGLLVTDAGRLIVAAGGTPVNYPGGMPVDSNGALCVSTVT